MKESTDAQAGNDLEHDDAWPGGVGLQVDEETVAQRHEEEAENDEFTIAAGGFDDDSCADGNDGETETDGEHVDTAEDRGGLEHGLEVQWEVVVSCNEGEGVGESGDEQNGVVPVLEQSDWDDGVFGKFPFVQHGQHPGHHTEDNQADDCGRRPGVVDAAEFEAEEKHERASNHE